MNLPVTHKFFQPDRIEMKSPLKIFTNISFPQYAKIYTSIILRAIKIKMIWKAKVVILQY